MRIYVAGKYSDTNVIEVLNNIREGTKVAAKILKMGHTPFCPWLDYHFQFYEPNLKVDDYYRYSMEWLKVSDAVFLLPGAENSRGTQKELEQAKLLCMPVYTKLKDLKYLPY